MKDLEIILIVIIVFLVFLVALLAYPYLNSLTKNTTQEMPPHVEITGIYATLYYSRPLLGVTTETFTGGPMNASLNEEIIFTVEIYNPSTIFTMHIENVSIAPPYTLVSYGPQGLEIPPQSYANLSIEFRAPDSVYSGPVYISIYATG